eukprot:CAMPEP_0184419290 /NCGR_PEP_ID=MMETSP0738-20130409/36690_1 /TAXON_ID=385413 /ORGANISM="Thalassiosira miniscula, Strain CCMP1093" /LENGTH=103 /DNA_ID=CAMNT_0026779723 /DNA_START=46 /DNA_END=357 /DNA_ORIENTATION=-
MKDTTAQHRPTLTLDVTKYDAMLNAPDLDAETRKDILEALWVLICGFVDLGFAVEPQDPVTCGQLGPITQLLGAQIAHTVECGSALGTALEDAPASQTKGART